MAEWCTSHGRWLTSDIWFQWAHPALNLREGNRCQALHIYWTPCTLQSADIQPKKWRIKYCPSSLLSRRRYLSTGTAHNGPSLVCMWASWSCAARSNRSGSWCHRGFPTCFATHASEPTRMFLGNQFRFGPILYLLLYHSTSFNYTLPQTVSLH